MGSSRRLAAIAALLEAASPPAVGWVQVWRRLALGSEIRPLPLAETIGHLERHGLSLARWGDGETECALGHAIRFQAASDDLAAALRQLLREPDPRILLGLPTWPLEGPLRLALHRRGWLKTRFLLAALARPGTLYADAFAFRDQPDAALALIRAAAARRTLVLIASSDRRDADYFAGLACAVRWLPVPARDAFAESAAIAEAIAAAAGSEASQALALISAGPAAKVIVKRLAGRVMCWDTGYLFGGLRHELRPPEPV